MDSRFSAGGCSVSPHIAWKNMNSIHSLHGILFIKGIQAIIMMADCSNLSHLICEVTQQLSEEMRLRG